MDLPINQIVCGDCLEVMRDWPDKCVDLVLTSPPYDDMRDYNGSVFSNELFNNIACLLYHALVEGGVLVWVVGDATLDGSETGSSFRQALAFRDVGFNIHDTMIYAKRGFAMPSSGRYHQVFEYMFVLSKGTPATFNPIKDRKNAYKKSGSSLQRQKDGSMAGERHGIKNDDYGMRWNIWEYGIGGGVMSTDRSAHLHPAIFPEQLAIDHVRSWSDEGMVVMDPFCGSGTTCVAAKMLGRNYIGIDISEEYCQIARDRLKAVDTGVPVAESRNGQMALFDPERKKKP